MLIFDFCCFLLQGCLYFLSTGMRAHAQCSQRKIKALRHTNWSINIRLYLRRPTIVWLKEEKLILTYDTHLVSSAFSA